MKALRIFLFILIIVGFGLIFTQKTWVPKVVDYILIHEEITPIIVPITPKPKPTSTSTPVVRVGKIDSGVEGIVTIGPTCPVERIPPDPQCADKPYQTTLVVSSNTVVKGGGILVHTDTNGYFSVVLESGTYTIRAQPETMMPSLSPVTFVVTPHNRTSLNLQFDSGIR